jgi:hypothetical protein
MEILIENTHEILQHSLGHLRIHTKHNLILSSSKKSSFQFFPDLMFLLIKFLDFLQHKKLQSFFLDQAFKNFHPPSLEESQVKISLTPFNVLVLDLDDFFLRLDLEPEGFWGHVKTSDRQVMQPDKGVLSSKSFQFLSFKNSENLIDLLDWRQPFQEVIDVIGGQGEGVACDLEGFKVWTGLEVQEEVEGRNQVMA